MAHSKFPVQFEQWSLWLHTLSDLHLLAAHSLCDGANHVLGAGNSHHFPLGVSAALLAQLILGCGNYPIGQYC